MTRRLVLLVLGLSAGVSLAAAPGMTRETAPAPLAAPPAAAALRIVPSKAAPVVARHVRHVVPRVVPRAARYARQRVVARPAAPKAPGCDGRPGWEQVRGARALAQLGYPVEQLSFTVEFLPAHAGYTGLTDAGARRIQVFVRPCAQQSDASLLFTVAHEVGHAIDAAHLDDTRHRDWMAARGRTGATWFGCGGCNDFGTGAGDFAETFALWRTGDSADYHSTFAPRPTPAQLTALIPMFDVAY